MKRGLSVQRVGFGKRGQFYLIAAIILATIIIGINVVANYSKKQSSERLDNLKEELQIESANVLDYGLNNNLNDIQMNQLLESFSEDYINSKGKDKNLYFLLGDTGNLTVVAYQSTAESVTINSGSGNVVLNVNQGEIFKEYFSPSTAQVSLIVNEFTHNFKLEGGENFYFLISQKSGEGGSYVIRN